SGYPCSSRMRGIPLIHLPRTADTRAGQRAMTRGLRQSMLSLTVFAIVLGGLVFVDPRVRDRFTALMYGGDGMSSVGDRATEFGDALLTAARYQSIEHAPLLIFATVGILLFFFMLKT